MANYNSIEAQYPTEYGLWDDDVEARIDQMFEAIDAFDEDSYEDDIFDEDFDDLSQEIDALSNQLTQADIENAHLEVQVNDLRTELDALLVRCEVITIEDARLREDNRAMAIELLELRQRVRNAEAHADELNDHLTELVMSL